MKPQVEVESRMAKRGERRRTARRVTRRTRAWAVVVVHRWTPSLEAGGGVVRKRGVSVSRLVGALVIRGDGGIPRA